MEFKKFRIEGAAEGLHEPFGFDDIQQEWVTFQGGSKAAEEKREKDMVSRYFVENFGGLTLSPGFDSALTDVNGTTWDIIVVPALQPYQFLGCEGVIKALRILSSGEDRMSPGIFVVATIHPTETPRQRHVIVGAVSKPGIVCPLEDGYKFSRSVWLREEK